MSAQQKMVGPELGKTVRKAPPHKLKLAEFERPDFRLIITDLNTTKEEVLRPEYWANHGAALKGTNHRFPRIEVIWEDGSKLLELLVVDADRLWAKVRVLNYYEFKKAKVAKPNEKESADGTIEPEDQISDEFLVKYVPTAKWYVLRKSDNETITKDHGTKEAAEGWLKEYLQGLE